VSQDKASMSQFCETFINSSFTNSGGRGVGQCNKIFSTISKMCLADKIINMTSDLTVDFWGVALILPECISTPLHGFQIGLIFCL